MFNISIFFNNIYLAILNLNNMGLDYYVTFHLVQNWTG